MAMTKGEATQMKRNVGAAATSSNAIKVKRMVKAKSCNKMQELKS